jgi:hypothetical protein
MTERAPECLIVRTCISFQILTAWGRFAGRIDVRSIRWLQGIARGVQVTASSFFVGMLPLTAKRHFRTLYSTTHTTETNKPRSCVLRMKFCCCGSCVGGPTKPGCGSCLKKKKKKNCLKIPLNASVRAVQHFRDCVRRLRVIRYYPPHRP